MNTQSRKESEATNAQGEVERKVVTVDHCSSAGKSQELKTVEVIHQYCPQSNQTTSGDVLTGAAAAVASALESAKDAISRK